MNAHPLIAETAPDVAPVSRSAIVSCLDDWLQPMRFRDYGPNGLQVEGRPEIRRLVSGVTASLALIDRAIALRADAILVHHGLFWRGQDGRVTGWMKQRLARLLAHDINVLAYHLPLDAHPEWGNNAQLGLRLGIEPEVAGWGRFGDQDLGFVGRCVETDVADLVRHVEAVLGRSVVWVQGSERPVRRVGWCTGGGQSYFEAAIAAGVDVFLTGEISEPQAHLARECGVSFLACGHHATERYGVQAVAAQLAERFSLWHAYVDGDNPA